MGIFDSKRRAEIDRVKGGALQQAADGVEEGGLAGMATDLIEKLLDVGIDGRGPFLSAHQVADAARSAGSVDAAITSVTRRHAAMAGVGGFVTGLGGFITMPVALPANVAEFYLVATRMVASIARLRGYDIDQPQIRTAILLTLVGADADDLLRKAGNVAGVSTLGVGGKLTDLAAGRLPGPALMVLNKAVGFRLVAQAGRSVLERFGKALPVIGGAAGAGLDVFMLSRIAANARREFPMRSAG